MFCEQKCYFSLTENGSRVMLNCEPTVGQVHALSHPVSHDLAQSSPSLKVSVALLVLLKEWPHDLCQVIP